VEFLQRLFERRHVFLLPRVGSSRPAENVQAAASEDGRRFDLPGQPPNPPHLLASRHFVSGKFQRACDNHLQRALRRFVKNRRRKSPRRVRTFNTPSYFSGVFIHGDEERIGFRIAIEQHFIFSQHWRSAHPERIVERAQRQSPTFLALPVERNQTEIGEESINIPPVCDRAGRGGGGIFLQFLRTRCGSLPAAPEFSPPARPTDT